MARTSELDKMSYAQLAALRNKVDAAMAAALSAEKQKLRAEMEAMAARAGLSLLDVVNGRASGHKPKGAKVAPKYRNPQNPSQTWAGRGRQPTWLVAALKKGRKLESFRI